MSCDLCHCEDHPNEPCANCLNCVGHYEKDCDWDKIHTQQKELAENSQTVHTKPHYVYNGKTRVIQPKNEPVQKITE